MVYYKRIGDNFMNEILVHILLFVCSILGGLGLIKLYAINEEKKQKEKELYKGYESPVKKPILFKHDLFVNWVYEAKEEEAKKKWLESQEEKKKEEVEDAND